MAGLSLAACTPDPTPIEGTERIECRLAGHEGFERVCTSERMATPDGTVLTVRQPDGGFRRLLIVADGRGVVAADGAEPVTVRSVVAGSIDVTAGDMVYRLSARIGP